MSVSGSDFLIQHVSCLPTTCVSRSLISIRSRPAFLSHDETIRTSVRTSERASVQKVLTIRSRPARLDDKVFDDNGNR